MRVHISRAAWEAILSHVAARPEVEVCGLLLGTDARITQARTAANVADDPARRFELDPAVLIAAHRDARMGAAHAVLGHYHSHPTGSTQPSACDAEQAYADGSFWLICAPDGSCALWKAGTGGLHGCFVRVDLIVCDE